MRRIEIEEGNPPRWAKALCWWLTAVNAGGLSALLFGEDSRVPVLSGPNWRVAGVASSRRHAR